jgi:hypothetical protein
MLGINSSMIDRYFGGARSSIYDNTKHHHQAPGMGLVDIRFF